MNIKPPAIQIGDGEPTVGATLVATTGDWTPTPAQYEYQWRRTKGDQTSDIPEATDKSYEPTAEDVGFGLLVAVTPLNEASTSVGPAAVSSTTVPVSASP